MTDQKPYGPPPDAIPLSDAMKEYLPAEMWEEHARATEARKNAPKRPSYLSMSVRDWQDAKDSHDAANRTRSARADLHRVWNGMLAAMKAKLEAGELTAFGQDDPPFGPWHAIPAPAWRQLRITNVRKGEASVGANIVHDIHILPPDADDHMPTGTPGRPDVRTSEEGNRHHPDRVSAPRRCGRNCRKSRRRSAGPTGMVSRDLPAAGLSHDQDH